MSRKNSYDAYNDSYFLLQRARILFVFPPESEYPLYDHTTIHKTFEWEAQDSPTVLNMCTPMTGGLKTSSSLSCLLNNNTKNNSLSAAVLYPIPESIQV